MTNETLVFWAIIGTTYVIILMAGMYIGIAVEHIRMKRKN